MVGYGNLKHHYRPRLWNLPAAVIRRMIQSACPGKHRTSTLLPEKLREEYMNVLTEVVRQIVIYAEHERPRTPKSKVRILPKHVDAVCDNLKVDDLLPAHHKGFHFHQLVTKPDGSVPLRLFKDLVMWIVLHESDKIGSISQHALELLQDHIYHYMIMKIVLACKVRNRGNPRKRTTLMSRNFDRVSQLGDIATRQALNAKMLDYYTLCKQDCPSRDKICNPTSRRCVSKTGRIGKKLLRDGI